MSVCIRQAEKHGAILQALVRRYKVSKAPIPVSFRDMVSPTRDYPRALHSIHPYPGKLLFHIPFFFICNDFLSVPGSLVADPFCGSGTVLLESLFVDRDSVGADSNPLARLISKVKTTAMEMKGLKQSARELVRMARTTEPERPPDVVNLTYWFHSHTIRQLSQIRRAIRENATTPYRDFFSLCFSACIRKVSLADPRVSVPVRLRYDQYPQGHRLRKATHIRLNRLREVDAMEVFQDIVGDNVQRFAAFEPFATSRADAQIVGTDARNLDAIQKDSIDIVVTSPPYMGAQKYIRSSSLELGWLGLARTSDLRDLEGRCLGREHFRKAEYQIVQKTGIKKADALIGEIYKLNPLRAYLAANYLNEMRPILTELYERMRSGGYLVLVCSNNSVCGLKFTTQEFLRSILIDLSLQERLRLVDTIRSRSLMTKRHKTASVILHEWVLLFQKP